MNQLNTDFRYNFFGVVHPERADVNISQITLSFIHGDLAMTAEVVITVTCSQIAVVVSSKEKIEDIASLKNYIEEIVRLEIDILGYIKGHGYGVEIIQMLESSSLAPVVFGVGISALEITEREVGEEFTAILQLFSDGRSEVIRRSLADFREAIRSPKDTAFFCFRAVESLRYFFLQSQQAKDKKQSWECLRDETGISQSDIREIQNLADPARHGESPFISGEQRDEVYLKTKKILNLFLAYAKNGYKKL